MALVDKIKLLFRRGAEADRAAYIPANGEPIWVSDDKKLYIGDGSTPGGIPAGGGDFVEKTGDTMTGDLALSGVWDPPSLRFDSLDSSVLPDLMTLGVWGGSGTLEYRSQDHDEGSQILLGPLQLSLSLVANGEPSTTVLIEDGRLIPDYDITYDLGVADLRWKNLYAGTVHADDLEVAGAPLADTFLTKEQFTGEEADEPPEYPWVSYLDNGSNADVWFKVFSVDLAAVSNTKGPLHLSLLGRNFFGRWDVSFETGSGGVDPGINANYIEWFGHTGPLAFRVEETGGIFTGFALVRSWDRIAVRIDGVSPFNNFPDKITWFVGVPEDPSGAADNTYDASLTERGLARYTEDEIDNQQAIQDQALLDHRNDTSSDVHGIDDKLLDYFPIEIFTGENVDVAGGRSYPIVVYGNNNQSGLRWFKFFSVDLATANNIKSSLLLTLVGRKFMGQWRLAFATSSSGTDPSLDANLVAWYGNEAPTEFRVEETGGVFVVYINMLGWDKVVMRIDGVSAFSGFPDLITWNDPATAEDPTGTADETYDAYLSHSSEPSVEWKGKWAPGEYQKNSIVTDGAWTMVTNKNTSDPAAPQPIGDPYYAFDGVLAKTPVSAKQLIFGTRYTPSIALFISGYRLDLVEGFHYNVFSVEDPLGEHIPTQLFSGTSDTTGWKEFSTKSLLVAAGTVFDLIVQVSATGGTPATWVGNWDYLTPNNVVDPAAGEIVHATKALGELRIHKMDSDGVDGAAELAALAIGDTINALGMRWSIQAIVDSGMHFTFTVSPLSQTSPPGITEFTFETVIETALPYGWALNHWTDLSAPVQGLLGIDIGYDDITPDGHAYGVDIKAQEVNLSEDWDLLAHSEGGGTSAPAEDAITGGYKNKLLNGDFRINQRGFDGNWSAKTGGAFGYDRWHANMTPPTQIIQKVEPENLKPGQTYTLSWGSPTDGALPGASWLGGDNAYHSSLTSPVTFVYVAGATQPRAYIPVDSTWAQLEEGDKATSFEKRFIGTELAMCHRYFLSVAGTVFGGSGYYYSQAGAAKGAGAILFPVTMRDKPAVTASMNNMVNCTDAIINTYLTGSFMRCTVTTEGSFRIYSSDPIVFDAEL